MKRKILIVLAVVVLLPVFAVGGLALYLVLGAYEPAPLESVTIEKAPTDADPRAGLVAGEPFTLLSWNVQFGAGKTEKFFYSGGTRVRATRAELDATVPAIAKVIADQRPDVLLLQELDRYSARTLYEDQFPVYLKAGGFGFGATAPYHRAPFVPKPFTDPLGEVDMHLGIMTRGPLQDADRIQLALLKENPVFQAANLKRAMLTVEIPVEGHPLPLAVANTHLSAFSWGDGTLQAQVDQLVEWIEARPPNQPWILAGDFNLLPPGFDTSVFGERERELYSDATNPIDKLLPKYTAALGDQLAPENRTHVAVGQTVPDRKIDYILVGGPIEVISGETLPEHHALSDHVPLKAVLRIGKAPAPEAPAEAPTPEGAAPEGAAPADPPADAPAGDRAPAEGE